MHDVSEATEPGLIRLILDRPQLPPNRHLHMPGTTIVQHQAQARVRKR